MEMARPWFRRISRLAIAVAVIAALAVPWAFRAVTTAVVMTIGKVIPPLSLPLIVLLAVEATLVLFAAIWWLWWRLPKRQVRGLDIQIHEPKARADTEDNFRKNRRPGAWRRRGVDRRRCGVSAVHPAAASGP
jgi:hypothetical protein